MAEIIDNEAINNRLNDEETMYEGDILEPKRQQVEKAKEELLHALVKAQPEPQPRVRKPRTVTPAKNTPSAKVIVSDAVQRLKDKIVALEYINGVVIGDLPAAAKINKDIRDNIVQFQKDMEKLKADWLYKIHKI